jgi:serine phosphatase RsbU (regulator of sigma subunit)
LVAIHLPPDGELEILNAGSVEPLLVSEGTVRSLPCNNLPVGLLEMSEFHTDRTRMKPGDRLIATTDGIVEAENADYEYFGNDRLMAVAVKGFAEIELELQNFRGSAPQSDDLTLLELTYHGVPSDLAGSS